MTVFFRDFRGRLTKICIYMLGTNTKPAALNPVMQPQRTKLISVTFNLLPWDNEGDGNNLPLMPLVKELVHGKTLSCFNVKRNGKWTG